LGRVDDSSPLDLAFVYGFKQVLVGKPSFLTEGGRRVTLLYLTHSIYSAKLFPFMLAKLEFKLEMLVGSFIA